MLKFLVTTEDGGQLIGLGISQGNVDRLMAGQPILVKMEELGLPKGEIMIFYGRTEKELIEQVKPFIGQDTTIVPVPENNKGNFSDSHKAP